MQLYDLSKDIGETNNVQAGQSSVVRRLTRILEKYVTDGRSTRGAPQPNTGPVPIRSKPEGKVENHTTKP
ncbi:MAG TPA: hypothetical protein VFA77_11385 [Candidatus Eisenbacteria bacterium]|nr:hypothetical protein [Candidatus Eisenbacteria bacterium]